MRNSILVLLILLVASILSTGCSTAMHGYTSREAQNRYMIVDADTESFGYKRLTYIVGYRGASISYFIDEKGFPDYLYEFVENRRQGFIFYYLNEDRSYVFLEQNWSPDSAVNTEIRWITDLEKSRFGITSVNRISTSESESTDAFEPQEIPNNKLVPMSVSDWENVIESIDDELSVESLIVKATNMIQDADNILSLDSKESGENVLGINLLLSAYGLITYSKELIEEPSKIEELESGMSTLESKMGQYSVEPVIISSSYLNLETAMDKYTVLVNEQYGLTIEETDSEELTLRVANEAEIFMLKQAVIDSLFDPDSASFREGYIVGNDRACLAFNAKNRFGGYVGFKQAVLVKSDDTWVNLTAEDSLARCLILLNY